MKKLFTLLALIVCAMGTYADEIDVVLDKNTATSKYGESSPWYFKSNDVEVKIANDKSQNFWYDLENKYNLENYPQYSANVDFTITLPVNFIASKITFSGFSLSETDNTSLIFNNSEAKTFTKLNEQETTQEFAWPEGEQSAVFQVKDWIKNTTLAATITITGKLYTYYATMSKSGFCTFSADKNVMVSEGVKIWGVNNCIESNNNYTITTTNLSNDGNKIINASKGVILQGTPNKTYLFDETSSSASMWPVGEILKPAITATKVENDYTFVLICNKNNDAQFAHLKNGSTIPAGKAYLEIPGLQTNSAYTLSLYFSDATGIHEVKANKTDDNYYSLDGKKLSARPEHGTYIHQGHVYMAK